VRRGGPARAGTDEDGDGVTWCDNCQPAPGAGVDIIDLEQAIDTGLDSDTTSFEEEL
jgi:hypothetical protein